MIIKKKLFYCPQHIFMGNCAGRQQESQVWVNKDSKIPDWPQRNAGEKTKMKNAESCQRSHMWRKCTEIHTLS